MVGNAAKIPVHLGPTCDAAPVIKTIIAAAKRALPKRIAGEVGNGPFIVGDGERLKMNAVPTKTTNTNITRKNGWL